jgi:hypothetical protein
LCTYGEAVLGTYDVYLWESVGGWTNVGQIAVTGDYQRHIIDIGIKLDTWNKINEVKMYLRRVG